jgi:hypothetical protein
MSKGRSFGAKRVDPNHVAPFGKFRVTGKSLVDGSEWLECDKASLKEARLHAWDKAKGSSMTVMHIYDSQANYLGEESSTP